MSRYVDAVSGFDYRQEREGHIRASNAAAEYRSNYLGLRKRMREFFRDQGMTPPDDIKKLIGWRG